MKTHNLEMAFRAERNSHLSIQRQGFGHFACKDAFGETINLVFVANRYAYVGSPLHLDLFVSTSQKPRGWEPYTTLTVNFRPNECTEKQIIVKTYGENEHLREPLLASGYFIDTGDRITVDYVVLEIWRSGA